MNNSENIKVLDRAFDVLECFSENEQELSMVEIAKKTNLSVSTVFRIIGSLENRNYVYRNSITKRYSLGAKITYLGGIGVGASIEILKTVSYAYLLALRDKLDESISVYIRNDENRICIARVESTQSLRQVIRLGELYSVKQGATGHILLAYAPQAEQERLFGADDKPLREKLLKVKEQGHAITIGDRAAGVAAVAAPIFDGQGNILGALSVSGPAARIIDQKLSDKVELIKTYARKITMELGFENNLTSCSKKFPIS